MQTGEHGQSLCDTLQIKTLELRGSDAMMTERIIFRSDHKANKATGAKHRKVY